MQANCPQCSQKIAIDDAKVPDRPFNVRCPKCQNVVKLPGKGAPETAAGAPAAAPPLPVPPPAAPPETPKPAAVPEVSEELRAQMMAQLRREMSTGGESGGVEKALVAFPDAAQSAAIGQTLTRIGYVVETIDDADEAGRQLEQGAFAVLATARMPTAPGRTESLYQRAVRLSPEARRRLFVILVGDEFKSGDSTQSFVTMADLVLHTRDAAAADGHVRAYQAARKRLFQPMEEARKRVDASAI